MKAAPFEYARAADVDEACAWLAADDGARLIAGGQTLVPMMAMRLARPTRLIDINRIAKVPLLARAIPNIGHTATRARGTIGGSLANADPAAEISLIAVTLDATLSYRAGGKTTDIPARGFHVGAMVTSLPEGACLTAVRFPVWQGRIGTGFHEVNARSSDFAFVSAAAQIELGADNKCKRIVIGVGAATDHPIRLESAERQLAGGALDPKAVRAAVEAALTDIEALDDLHATAAYRRRVAAVLAARAVADAFADAQGKKVQGNANAH